MHPRTSLGKVEYLDLSTVFIATESANNENLCVFHAQTLPSMTRCRYPDYARLSTYDTWTENFCIRGLCAGQHGRAMLHIALV